MTQYDKTIEYSTVTGTVTSSKKFSETNVSVSGGGASVSGFGRFTSVTTNPVYVSDDSYINHEIWLTTDDGKEKSVKICGSDIPLREGQKITLIYLVNKGVSNSVLCVLINHNNRQYYKTISNASACVALRLCDYQKYIDYPKAFGCGVVAGIFTLFVTVGSIDKDHLPFIPWIIGLMVFGGMVFYRNSENRRIRTIVNNFSSKLDKAISKISQQILP